MSSKIPSSLKWLIDKRARLDAEIKKTRASLTRAQQLMSELAELEAELAAIDRTTRLHEIRVNVDDIPPVRSHYVRINLPRGELTRSVLLCLRLRDGEITSMREIVAFVVARHGDLVSERVSKTRLNRSVHDCVKRLYRRGLLQRHHAPDSNSEGLWSLNAA